MPARKVRLTVLTACLMLLALLIQGNNTAPVSTAGGIGSAPVFTASNPPSQTALNSFYSAAFRGEYSDTERNTLIKWETPLRIFLQGDMTEEDIRELDTFLQDLKEKVPDLPEIIFASTQENANVTMSFVPYGRMDAFLSYYVTGNWGFVNCFSDDATIQKGLIAIASDVTRQEDRNQIIREEFVNMLGLTNDLSAVPESILYQGYNNVQALAQVDYDMLNILYSPYTVYGMGLEETRAKLKEIFKGP